MDLYGSAHFIWKPSNLDELTSVLKEYYENKHNKQQYKIIYVIHLDINEYIDFTRCLIGKNYHFLEPVADQLGVFDGTVHCVLITIKHNETKGILVNSEGSLYGRYCAIWKT